MRPDLMRLNRLDVGASTVFGLKIGVINGQLVRWQSVGRSPHPRIHAFGPSSIELFGWLPFNSLFAIHGPELEQLQGF